MESTKVIPVSSGYDLLCRPVPPDAFIDVYRAVPEPELPKVQIKSVAGGVEEKFPLEGTDEWMRYQEEQRAWRRKCRDLTQDFAVNYGVVGWRKSGTKDDFKDDVPKSWKLPAIMQAYGVEEKEGIERRLQYIRYALILTEADGDAVQEVITGRTVPLTKQEVEAAMAPFVSETTKDGR